MPRFIPGVFAIPTPDGTITVTPKNVYWVDPVNGSANNDGKTPSRALTKVSDAYDLCTANQNDVVALIGSASGTSTGAAGTACNETTAITWAKSFTHLVGICSPTSISQRARVVANASGLSPFITISGNGCIFANVQLATFQATGLILCSLTGDRNYFSNVHFAGIGNDTAGDDTTSRCISMTGANENKFYKCTIGLDTAAKSGANAEVELSTACERNVFEDCLFLTYADNAGHFFVIADAAADIDRFVLFKNCLFHNATLSAATTMTDAMKVHAAVGGSVILLNCAKLGTTGWADTLTAVVAGGFSSNSTYNQGIGFLVAPNA